MARPVDQTLDGLEQDVRAPRRRAAAAGVPAEGLSPIQREVFGLLLIVLSLILLLSHVSYDPGDVAPTAGTATANWIGPVGASLAHVVLSALGLVAFPVILTFGLVGVRMVRSNSVALSSTAVVAYVAGAVALATLVHLVIGEARPLGHPGGGTIGLYVGEVSRALISTIGTVIVFLAVLVGAVALLSRRPPRELAAAALDALQRGAGRRTRRSSSSFAKEWSMHSSTATMRSKGPSAS